MTAIHPTAVVDPAAELAPDVEVGPYAVIGPQVRIGAGTRVGAHVVIDGHTTIGRDNRIFAFAALGGVPQDMKYRGEATGLEIGDRNTIREFCTFNTGTVQDAGVTRVGHDNWIMAYVHLAHDVQLGSHCVLANNATLAGHVKVGDWVTLGGLSGVLQRMRIGAHAMIGFQGHVAQDVPPFMTADGNPLKARATNAVGLRRRGYSAARLDAVKEMHRLLYRSGLGLQDARQAIAALATAVPEAAADVAVMADFLAHCEHGIVR